MDLVEDLAADRLSSWVADVAAEVDIPHLAAGVTSGRESPFTTLTVPKPTSSQMLVPVLHPAVLVQLHRAMDPLRRVTERTLGPGVLSYRRGADKNWRYWPAWQVFSQTSANTADRARAVVFTDVADFFGSTSWTLALQSATSLASEQTTRDLRDVAVRLSVAGLGHLPSGYSDARLLGNIVLSQADRHLQVEYVRWVDDYRLFAASEDQARQALNSLSQGLSTIGLKLNGSKTRLLSGSLASTEIRNGLRPTYDLEHDSSAVIRKKLIGTLQYAAEKPLERRRELRHALSGLAREREACFVDWALRAVWEIPWETPRLVAYLAAVAHDPRVGPGVDLAMARAASEVDQWRVARLSPLVIQVCKEQVSKATLGALADALPGLAGSAAWGLALRTLSRAGCSRIVRAATADQVVDARAAMVALRDLDLSLPSHLCSIEPALAEALRYVPAPPPTVKSLL